MRATLEAEDLSDGDTRNDRNTRRALCDDGSQWPDEDKELILTLRPALRRRWSDA